MRRGEVWWADLPEPRGHRPVLILTRDRAISVRNAVTVAEITRTIRGIPVEVRLDEGDGMPTACVVNLDVINTVPKLLLTEHITALSDRKMMLVEAAIRFALGMRAKQAEQR
jgi:mRNA interferase MazF